MKIRKAIAKSAGRFHVDFDTMLRKHHLLPEPVVRPGDVQDDGWPEAQRQRLTRQRDQRSSFGRR